MALEYWHITPLNASLLIGLLAVYLYGAQRVRPWQTAVFVAGWTCLVIAVCSPLRYVASHNVMSAHMTAHVLVLMVGAPLMVLGLPLRAFTAGVMNKWSMFIGRNFWLAWIIGVGTMWFWHFPPLHNFMLHRLGIHFCYASAGGAATGWGSFFGAAYYPSLLIAGGLLVWPLVSPVKRLRGPYAVAYLFAGCVGCSLLGITIAFSPALLYDLPIMQPDPGALMSHFALTPADDQQWAGLIMWVPGCLLYAFASLAIMLQWFEEEEKLHPTVNYLRHD